MLLLLPLFMRDAKADGAVHSFAPSLNTAVSPVITNSPVFTNNPTINVHVEATPSVPYPAANALEQATKRDLDLTLTPHGKNSPELFLEALNSNGGMKVVVQLTVVAASPGVAFKTFSYDGLWVDSLSWSAFRQGVTKKSKRSVFLASHIPQRLRIASVEMPEKPEGMGYMYLEGSDDHVSWDIEKTKLSDLPYFELKLMFVANEHYEPITRLYRVGPETPLGPLQMTQLMA
ncbi:hypothetical protein [Granulicella sp. S156]|uniref:hypothetical protein n=1 Tax=Granulicella sp. S156 TaxID=1747224 RepID=UPI00131B9E21|nr:hypothetical protein [Granulicella sp. S156]